MKGGDHVLDYVFDGLRHFGALAIPALRLAEHPDAMAAVAQAVTFGGLGIGIIVKLEDLMQADAASRVLELVRRTGARPSEADIVIDMGGPNYEPYPVFANLLVRLLRHLGNLDMFRNLVLIGTAIPESMAFVEKGSGELPRHDWLFYRDLLSKLPSDIRTPVYGDHTIVHPSFTAKIDMRKVKPAGKVLYTKSNAWGTRKGGAFAADRGQMQSHCLEILTDPQFEFRGRRFSYGDAYIAGCAVGENGSSNQTRWKEVGINHHITTVVDALANLSAGASSV